MKIGHEVAGFISVLMFRIFLFWRSCILTLCSMRIIRNEAMSELAAMPVAVVKGVA